eukprot:scaffold12878_cov31-Tisochrysis_lutea.AAC.3
MVERRGARGSPCFGVLPGLLESQSFLSWRGRYWPARGAAGAQGKARCGFSTGRRVVGLARRERFRTGSVGRWGERGEEEHGCEWQHGLCFYARCAS